MRIGAERLCNMVRIHKKADPPVVPYEKTRRQQSGKEWREKLRREGGTGGCSAISVVIGVDGRTRRGEAERGISPWGPAFRRKTWNSNPAGMRQDVLFRQILRPARDSRRRKQTAKSRCPHLLRQVRRMFCT